MPDLFDIENDNNPSFYGDQLILTHPYKKSTTPDDLMNSTLGISSQIETLLNDANLNIRVISTERLLNVVVYYIRLNELVTVKRRYSEFASLRENLVKLFPNLIIPPIPKKHSLITYVKGVVDSNTENSIVEYRKRGFTLFLNDLISVPQVLSSKFLSKFFDPNYESCWENALNEPPVSLIPNNMLLANPLDPTDQNGLYSLLPGINFKDNLNSLKKFDKELESLMEQKRLYKLRTDPREHEVENSGNINESHKLILPAEFSDDEFTSIPTELINFELKLGKLLKILNELNKINIKTTKDFKSMVIIMIDLGANLNNFSLQVFDKTKNLSLVIEKFGSTIDSNFLNLESFLTDHLVAEWQEPLHQLIQYYYASLNLIKFYKFKILQFKLLYKLKFGKFQFLINNVSSEDNLDHLKDLSPSINQAIRSIKEGGHQKRPSLSSWYGLFAGNKKSQQNNPIRLNELEKDLGKLDQLIELANKDMMKLSESVTETYNEFVRKMEKKWLVLMIQYIKNGKKLFNENLTNFEEFRSFLTNNEERTMV